MKHSNRPLNNSLTQNYKTFSGPNVVKNSHLYFSNVCNKLECFSRQAFPA
jgi:hypothetical protein